MARSVTRIFRDPTPARGAVPRIEPGGLEIRLARQTTRQQTGQGRRKFGCDESRRINGLEGFYSRESFKQPPCPVKNDVKQLFLAQAGRGRLLSLTCRSFRLEGELAILTGETKTGPITVALRERLEREKRRQGAAARARELRAIAERCARHMGPGPSAAEHGDMLCDEQGLPR